MAESLLLDTCALIWLATGSEELSKETRSLIATAQKNSLPVVTGDGNFPLYGVTVLH